MCSGQLSQSLHINLHQAIFALDGEMDWVRVTQSTQQTEDFFFSFVFLFFSPEHFATANWQGQTK